MSTVSRDIRLSVIAEVQKYVAEMGKIPGITQKEAAAAGRKLASELAKAEAKAAAHSKQTAHAATAAYAGVATAIATVGREALQFGKDAYDSAIRWRDAMRDIGAEIPASLGDGLASAEESIGRIQDSLGVLSAELLRVLAPTIDVVADKLRDLTVGVAFVIERVSLAWTYLTQGEEAAFAQWQATQGELQTLSESLLVSTQAQAQAARDATEATREQGRVVQEVDKATRELIAAKQESIRESERAHEAAMAAYRAEAEAQAERVAKIKQEALVAAEQSTQAAAIDMANNAARADQRKASEGIIRSAAVETFQTLAGLVKEGTLASAIATRGAGIFSVGVNTAVAITKALAELGPVFGPPAAFAMGAAGVAQAEAIAAQPLPKFAGGGVVGGDAPLVSRTGDEERVITARRGEVVMTPEQQAVSGQRTIVLNTWYDNRLFSRQVIDDDRRGGALGRRLRPRGLVQRRDLGAR